MVLVNKSRNPRKKKDNQKTETTTSFTDGDANGSPNRYYLLHSKIALNYTQL